VTYQVRYTREARDDLRRLYTFQSLRDPKLAHKARETISRGMEMLKDFPFTCRKASPANPFLRELIIPFGSSGFIVLFDIEDASTVTIIAVRHQRQDDFM
jgi:plasmid stabilization system protein ParE